MNDIHPNMGIGVKNVILNVLNEIFLIGRVRMNLLTVSFKKFNWMLRKKMMYWNGFLIIDLKILNILIKEVLVLYTKQFGWMVLLIIGMMMKKNGLGLLMVLM